MTFASGDAARAEEIWTEMARQMGIEIRLGDPKDNRPGRLIVIPEEIDEVRTTDIDLNGLRRSVSPSTGQSASG